MRQESNDMLPGSVLSPLSANDSGEEVVQQNHPPMAKGSESPLFCPGEDAGKAERRRSLFRGLEDSPAPQQDTAAENGFDALPTIVQRYTGPSLNRQEKVNPVVSTQAERDSGGVTPSKYSELSALESQMSSSEDDISDFVVPDDTVSESEDSGPESDPECQTAARVSQTRVGRSSGLVNKQKIGKVVKDSRKNSKVSSEKTPPSKKRPGSRMLDELASHIEDVVKPTRDNMAGPLFNYETVKLTRKQKRELDLAKQDRCLSPRGTYNVKLLMEEQNRKIRGRKVFYNTEAIQKSPRFTTVAQASTNQTTQKAKARSQQPSDTEASDLTALDPKPSDIIIHGQAIMAEKAWTEWTKRKTYISKLLDISDYSYVERDHYLKATPRLDIPAYLPGGRYPPGFPPSIEKGLCVFSPTAKLFKNFSYFLRVVEQVAGRKEGVVKVIIPKECLHQQTEYTHTRSNEADSTVLKTCSTLLKDRKGKEYHFSVYEIATADNEGLTVATWRQKIDDERCRLQKLQIGAKFHDAWKQKRDGKDYSEKSMISSNNGNSSHIFCAADVPATDELRHALRCDNLKLYAYQGNNLSKSRSVRIGVNTPSFTASYEKSTVFGMRMPDLGAYSLNYLHDGAAKVWTVVRPTHHMKLEELLHGYVQRSRKSLIAVPRPKFPPTCDNFLKHNALYVPRSTLKMYDIPYTEVTQHIGEMVIVFPFAYHQAWNEGPNIAESMGYASDRWMIFPRNKLFNDCNRECSAGGPMQNLDLDFVSRPPSEEGEIGLGDLDFPDESGSIPGPENSTGPWKIKRKKTEKTSRDTDREDSDVRYVKRNVRKPSEGSTSWRTY